ncbi:MAG: hypothetical protein AB8G15_19680 [Saprospiraceae bacterium]
MTLFVANNLGILSYNGKEWSLHTFEVGKKKRSLAFDEHNNRLYVGLQGEFGYLNNRWEYVSLVDKIPAAAKDFDEVWDVFYSNSKTYFCTFQNIYIYDGEKISVIENKEGLNRAFLFEDKLYTQNQQGELLELVGDHLQKIPLKNKEQDIISGLASYDNNLFIFYQSGQIQSANTVSNENVFTPLSTALKGTFINHILRLSDTRIAISTQTAGLYLYDLQNQMLEQISTQDGLLTNACLRSFQDFAGNLWVGMQNGLALIDINSPMRLINEDVKIQGSGYEAYEMEEGTYYTTSNGIYFKDKNSRESIFLPDTEGPAYSIQNIGGKIYAGHHTGLFQLQKKQVKQIIKAEGIWQVKLLKSNPQYAIGGSYSGMYLFRLNENNELEPLHKIKGFNESSRFFEEDKKGRIWVGQFYKGLFQLKLSKDLKSITAKEYASSTDAPVGEQIILNSIDNEIYFSTKEGIYTLDQQSDQIIPAAIFEKEIGKQPVYLLKQDNKKNIYVYAKNIFGYYKQISSNNYVFSSSSLFQQRYSFNNDLLNASIHTLDGIMINANEGFIYYNPEKENRLALDNPLVTSQVYSVTLDSMLYERSTFGAIPDSLTRMKITHKAKVIQFFIESFQLKDVNNQLFQYYLEGFDEKYGNWTTATIKEYTNLREGKYSFRVRTRNSLGGMIESEPLHFVITPPLYRSIYAKVFYFLLLLSSLFAVSWYQKQNYKRKALKLEKQKQEQLAEKQQILEQLEKKSGIKLLRLKEEKMQSELVHLNKLLAASTMNLVVKNEFIDSIKEKLKEIPRKEQSPATKRALVQIEKEIDTTLRVQEDWEQFEYHFNKVHGDFLSRIRREFQDLSQNDQKLCAFLRLNLNTKEISNIMSISLRGVEIARYRLRKKLKLSKGQNLAKFVLAY